MTRRLPRTRRRIATAAALLVSALTLSGCGQSTQDAIRAKVQQLAQAVGQRDWATICRQVLAPAVVEHLTRNGIPCQQAMRLALGGIRQPEVSVGKVIIRKDRAWAITLTAAQGEKARLTAIALRQTSDGWRITSLDSPLSAAEGK
jgi:ketosteroid isomerase-like protein